MDKPTEPHTHIWRPVFKAPPVVHTLAEYRVCVCGCEELVNRGTGNPR